MDTRYYSGIKLVSRFVNRVFPEVDKQLEHWVDICRSAQDELLGKQALASIHSKRFHAQGGSVYALYPNADPDRAVRFIVALQTISDYLDNLCDRAGVQDEQSFRQLHLSIQDAVDSGNVKSDYYRFYPYRMDNGYLDYLVDECRRQLETLPSYHLVVEKIKTYAKLYSDLQTYKHLHTDVREKHLVLWANMHKADYPDIHWWEFAAATGSTLGIFVLFGAASDPCLTGDDVNLIDSAYFPWVCGLHILLDYYIDSKEDMLMGDLNFTYYYDSLKQCEERLSFFIENSFKACANLRYPGFHMTIVKGLLSMYLSDPKARSDFNRTASRNLIRNGGAEAVLYYTICRLLRFAGKL